MTELDPTLYDLAEAFGVATEYWDWQGRHMSVARDTVVAVLAALEIDASTPAAAAAALASHHRHPWTQMLPSCMTIREHRTASVWVHVPHGSPVTVWIELETGESRHELRQLENWTPPREIDEGWVGEASFEIPGDLPLGYHTLKAASGERQASMPLIITPEWLGLPERMGQHRGWGLATQLYSVRSRQSWGVGDLTDLEDLAVWSAAEHQADFVLVNPLHAAEPVPPIEPSPYLPSSRRFANPLYLRLERIPEYAVASPAQREEIDKIRVRLLDEIADSTQIERDRSWNAKREGPQDHLLSSSYAGTGSLVRSVSPPRGEWPGEIRHLGGARRGTRPQHSGLAERAAGSRVVSGCGLRCFECRRDRLPLLVAMADGGAARWHPTGSRARWHGARSDA